MASGGEVVRGRWELDPLGRHEFRWRDNDTWTGWVTDGARQSFDPLASAPRATLSKAFKGRRDSLKRLFLGIGAIGLGLAVTLIISLSATSPVEILPYGAILWGGVEVARSVRYLARGRQPLSVPTTPVPPRLDFQAELRLLDRQLHKDKLKQASYDLAAIKLRRKYNITPPELNSNT